jgi:hypothetical protein
LSFMRGIDQDKPGDLVGVAVGIDADVEPSA